MGHNHGPCKVTGAEKEQQEQQHHYSLLNERYTRNARNAVMGQCCGSWPQVTMSVPGRLFLPRRDWRAWLAKCSSFMCPQGVGRGSAGPISRRLFVCRKPKMSTMPIVCAACTLTLGKSRHLHFETPSFSRAMLRSGSSSNNLLVLLIQC